MIDDPRSVALARLDTNVKRSERRENVPFDRDFIKNKKRRPPLSDLIIGGRGGAVRLKLYLYITLVASGIPYDIKRPPTSKAWAERLALPPEAGARRVSDALTWLEDHKLIKRTDRVGAPAKITLRSARGDGTKYIPRRSRRYISVPLGFWRNGWLIDLSPTAIALLFVLLELQAGREGPQTVSPERREEYGLSADTWTRATKELVKHGLLTVDRTSQDENEYVFDRMRNTYWINVDRLDSPPAESPEGDAEEKSS